MGIIGGSLGYHLLSAFAPPPSTPGEDVDDQPIPEPSSSRLRQYFGDGFLSDLDGLTVIDFGCGWGRESVEIALECPGSRVIGLDIQPRFLERARSLARIRKVDDRVSFQTTTDERADVIISIDAFEHFDDPGSILSIMSSLLKPDGRVMISFGPTWLHPLGGHLFSVFPWAHLIFTEKALLRWRAGFRSDGAKSFGEVAGGLNRMRISHFQRLVNESALEFEWFNPVPIRGLRILRWPLFREFGTAIVQCRLRLRKPFQPDAQVGHNPLSEHISPIRSGQMAEGRTHETSTSPKPAPQPADCRPAGPRSAGSAAPPGTGAPYGGRNALRIQHPSATCVLSG